MGLIGISFLGTLAINLLTRGFTPFPSCSGATQVSRALAVETVSVSAIANYRYQYKLTRVMRYVCVSGLVRRMSLSLSVTCDVTHVTMISHPSDDQWLRHSIQL